MTGVLFHGPEVFDSGWAAKIMRAFPLARFMLAGTMSRTALHDSGLKKVETPGLLPSACVGLLERDCSAVILATRGKSRRSGLVFGSMIAERAAPGVPLVQAECTGRVFAPQAGACPASVAAALKKLGLSPVRAPKARAGIWEEGGRLCRRMTTAGKGDFVLVDGIVVGRALGGEVVLTSAGRRLTELRGVRVKPHGLEKLERLGGVDLRNAKLASTRALRRGGKARPVRGAGKGVAFIDHAGMHVYELAAGVAGAVTVGDDTTAIAGDILRRFGVPVIGIVDGDGDGLHAGELAPGSVVLTVKADDVQGLRVLSEIFSGKGSSRASFDRIKRAVRALLTAKTLSVNEY
ncbi:MAG: DUF2117 domain-containing protein [Elusimicrobiales bacterium]|nr:DUF2117 domain-containing protein [Elusimicrobiales bacterium]